MNIVQASSGEFLQPAAPGELRWTGHMADDVGNTYGPEPMASLIATADMLLLQGTRGTFRIPKAAVVKLGRGKMYPWMFKALRIHHRVPGISADLQFLPSEGHWRDVQARLKSLGYPT